MRLVEICAKCSDSPWFISWSFIRAQYKKLVSKELVSNKFGDQANEGGVDVGGGFRVRGDVSEILEAIVDVRASHDGACQLIRVGLVPRKPLVEALSTTHWGGILVDGHYGSAAVVHLQRWLLPHPYHVRSLLRVLAQNVIQLHMHHRDA